MSIYADIAAMRSATDPMGQGEWLLLDAAVLANAVYFAERSRSRREDGPCATEDPQPEVTVPRLCDFARSLLDRFQPSHALAAWDGARSWRKEPASAGGINGYKVGRPEKPLGLRALLRVAPDVFGVLGVASLHLDTHEADDLIATAAYRAPGCVIVSNDKDFAQCLAYGPGVRWWNPLAKLATDILDATATERGEWITAETVVAKWGVRPALFPQYQAIAGDAADSVPGCPGIGPVGAQQLVSTYGSISEIYLAVDRGEVLPRIAEKLLAGRASVIDSHRAVTLATFLPVVAPPIGPRRELDMSDPKFRNPFPKSQPGAVLAQLTTAAPVAEAPTEEPPPVVEAQPAPPPAPKRSRPAFEIPGHPAIPQAWRGVPKGQLRANTVGQCRMALAKAAAEAGHAVELTTPETRAAALVEQVAQLVAMLTGSRPWPAAEAETAAEPEVESVESLAPPVTPGEATEADRQRVSARILDVARNALATRSPAGLVMSRAQACNEGHKPHLRLSDAEVERLVATATTAHRIETEQAPEGHSPQSVAAARVQTPPAAAPVEPIVVAEAQRPWLYIDCQPLAGAAIELDEWATPFQAEICLARQVEHYLHCPYSEGPKLVATLIARHVRAGLPMPSLIVRRSSPLADACLPELRRAFGRANIVEATR